MTATQHRVPDPGTDVPDTAGGGWNPMWYHPLLAGAWLFFLAWLPGWSGLSPWWWVAVGAAVTPLAVTATTVKMSPQEYGQAVYDRARFLAGVAAASAAGWLAYAGHEIEHRLGRAVGTLMFWLLIIGGVYAILRVQAPRRAAERREERRADHEHAELVQLQTDVTRMWDEWFATAGVAVDIEDVVPTPAGYTLVLAAAETGGKLSDYNTLTGAMTTLATLGSRHYRKQGKPLRRSQLRPEPTIHEDQWLLHVNLEQPLKGDLPHPGDRGAGDWTQPITIGLYEDGNPLTLDMYARHLAMVAATGGGKSVLLHNLIEAATRCTNVIVMVATTSKLMPIIWPWLEPWLRGTTQRPVIEAVAGESLAEVLHLLKTVYRLTKERNALLGPAGSKHRATAEDPAFWLVLDEATDVATATEETVRTFDGKEWSAAKLFMYLTATLRSAGGGIAYFTQNALYDALGKYGSQTMRNVRIRIAGRTEVAYDGQVTLRGIKSVDTTELRDNTVMVQPDNETPRAIPAKVRLLDSVDQIRPLAIANTRYRPTGFPQWLVNKLGPTWTERWLPDRQATLVAACEREGITYPITADGRAVPGRYIPPEFLPPEPVALPGHTSQPAAAVTEAPTDRHDVPRELPGQQVTGDGHDQMPETPAIQHNPLSGTATGGTLTGMTTTPDVHKTPTVADLARASEQAMNALRSMNDYPLGKSLTFARKAFNMRGAPDQAAAGDIAVQSGLIDGNAPEHEIEAVAAKVVRAVAHLVPVMPDQGTPAADVVLTRDQVTKAWDTALDMYREFQQANGAGTPAGDETVVGFTASVLDAVRDRPDDEWLLVADLGRAAGHIPAGDDTDAVRESARQFSLRLRAQFGVSEETGTIKRWAGGKVVRVGALRARVTA